MICRLLSSESQTKREAEQAAPSNPLSAGSSGGRGFGVVVSLFMVVWCRVGVDVLCVRQKTHHTIKMTGKQKTGIAAGGIVLVAVVSALLILLSTGKMDLGKSTLRIVFSVIFAFSLIRRATWARWLVGVLSGLSAAMSLFIFLDGDMSKTIIMSWTGVWMILMTGFYLWVTYSLLFDRDVVAYFKSTDQCGGSKIGRAEQAAT